MTFTIEHLTLKNIDKYVLDLLRLDKETSEEMGPVFGNDIWNEASFSRDLKSKWESSQIAFTKPGRKICGFIISSEQLASELHIHRFAVSWQCRGRGIGDGLIKKLDDIVPKHGFRRITVEVNCRNERAISFYTKHGYECMSGRVLLNYAEKRKNDVLTYDNHIRERDGAEFYILEKSHRCFV